MEQQFLPEKDRAYRIQVLQDNAERSEDFTYRKGLSDDDLTVRKDDVIQKIFQINKQEAEKSEIVKQYNQKIKELRAEYAKHLEAINMGSVEVTETVYLIPDYDENRMGYYNGDGNLVYSRPLSQDERQGRMHFLKASNQ